ncbi:MAG: hypothetical protein ACREVZ_13975, partial [Burkholderiales bacterium]
LFNGRYYEVVIADEISWDAVRAAAEGMTHLGVQGQLATINSLEEDQFIDTLRQTTLAGEPPGVTGSELWVGGFQEDCEPEPACGWQWINGEAISDVNTDSPYTNWHVSEPNDDNAPSGDEKHLGIGLGGVFGWNDEGRVGNVFGYVVEYGDTLASFPASNCAAGGPGCPLGSLEDAQVIRFPPQAIVGDGNLTATSFRISVPCGHPPLVLFDGAVVIPTYLCGENVVATKTESDVEIPKGVVTIENQSDNPFGCDAPIPAGADPTEQDAVAYQTTAGSDMLESGFVTSVDPRFVGTVAEVTNGCGSPSRGSGGKGSWWFAGLRIDPGTGNDRATSPLGNHMFMVALQRYKLQVLRAAVLAAKPALKKVDWLALNVLINSAIFLHDRNYYSAALFKVRLLLKLNDKITYTIIAGKNPYGEIEYRALNAEDIYSRRLIPFAP